MGISISVNCSHRDRKHVQGRCSGTNPGRVVGHVSNNSLTMFAQFGILCWTSYSRKQTGTTATKDTLSYSVTKIYKTTFNSVQNNCDNQNIRHKHTTPTVLMEFLVCRTVAHDVVRKSFCHFANYSITFRTFVGQCSDTC